MIHTGDGRTFRKQSSIDLFLLVTFSIIVTTVLYFYVFSIYKCTTILYEQFDNYYIFVIHNCINVYAAHTQDTQVLIKLVYTRWVRKHFLIDHDFEINRTRTITFTTLIYDIFGPGDAFDVDDSIFNWILELHRDQWAEVTINICVWIEIAGDTAWWYSYFSDALAVSRIDAFARDEYLITLELIIIIR